MDEVIEALIGVALVIMIFALILGGAGFVLWFLIKVAKLAITGTW